jgi:uncharacterized protein
MDKINLKAYIEKIEGKMVAIATDETVDRHGESLSIDAWDLKNYKKNPVLQFAHDYNTPPVGIAKNIRRDGKRLLFEPVFHEFTQLAKDVKKLFDEGIMKAFSVGFIPHHGRKDNGEQYTSLELLEISAVPIPANPAAIVIEKALKADEEKELDKDEFTAWTKEVYEDEVEQKAGKVISKKNRNIIQNAVNALNALLEADMKEDPEKSIDLVEGDDDEEEMELKIFTEKPKAKQPQVKGRSQVDLQKSLVALEGSIGFIKREVIRQRKN